MNKAVEQMNKERAECEVYDRLQHSPIAKHVPVDLCISSTVLFLKFFARNELDLPAMEENAKKYLDAEYMRDKKTFRRICNDAIFSYCFYGVFYSDFFKEKYYLYNYFGKKRELPDGRLYGVYMKFNNTVSDDAVISKWGLYNEFGEMFYRKSVPVMSEGDFDAFREFMEVHEKFILKPNRSYGGQGVQLVKTSEIKKDIKAYFDEVLENYGEAVLEEVIVQSDAMNYFNKTSVNSVRALIVRKKTGPQIIWSGIRYGNPDAIVDNISAGGQCVLVDIKTGITIGYTAVGACDEITGKQIIGIQLPDYDDLIKKAYHCSDIHPQAKLIAFDFAHTAEHGWVLVEANDMAGVWNCNFCPIAITQDKLDELYKEI